MNSLEKDQKNRNRHSLLLKIKNRTARFDLHEKVGLGFITIISFLYSSLYAMFNSFLKGTYIVDIVFSNKVFENIFFILNLITSSYNIFILYVLISLFYYKRLLDPYKRVRENFELNRKFIYESISKSTIDNSEFSGRKPYISDQNDSDLEVLTTLGVEAWKEIHISRSERRGLFRKWYSINQEVFSFLYEKITKTYIGYVCVLPMKDKNNSHYQNFISQFALGEEDIVNSHTLLLYVQALYIQFDYRDNLNCLTVLLNELFKKFIEFSPNEDKDLIIYAEGFTEEGIKLLKLFGFNNTRKRSLEGYPIYDFRYTPQGESNYNVQYYLDTKKAIRTLRASINES